MFVFSTVLAITAVLTIATGIDGNNTDDDDDDDGQKQSEKPRGMKRGAKKGSKQTAKKKTRQDWYDVCVLYTKEYNHMTYGAFLRSEATGPLFEGTNSEKISFGKMILWYLTRTSKT